MTTQQQHTAVSQLARVLPLIGVGGAILALAATAGAEGARAHARLASTRIVACEARHSGALYIAPACRRHDKRLVWNAAGRQGLPGQAGSVGPAGPAGVTGANGAQGPGAIEYTYESTAPAGSEQNTPLGRGRALLVPDGQLHGQREDRHGLTRRRQRESGHLRRDENGRHQRRHDDDDLPDRGPARLVDADRPAR